jgi:outer membrane receptor protein involved in Fe transport
MDAANTQSYGGHTLLNVRGQFRINDQVQLFARVLNLADRRYAESSSYTLQRGREFAPGMPRTAFVGVSLGWRP